MENHSVGSKRPSQNGGATNQANASGVGGADGQVAASSVGGGDAATNVSSMKHRAVAESSFSG